jgi:HSP20 family protein
MINTRLFDFPGFGWRGHFQELDRIRRNLDSILNQVENRPAAMAASGVFPLINLTEDKDSYYIRAELPGVKAADLSIETTDNNISIAGERKIGDIAKNAKYHRREREYGRFSRIIAMPKRINRDKIEAKLAEGILDIVIPKAESEKPRQITIK